APIDARAELAASADDLARLELTDRVAQLGDALDAATDGKRRAYVEQHGVCGVARFHSTAGARIYQLSVETFPKHVNNVYVVLEPGSALMLDCGSGFESSRRDLALGFAVLRAMYAEEARYEALDFVVVSHAHLDHFG